jgi:hypothetical protein
MLAWVAYGIWRGVAADKWSMRIYVLMLYQHMETVSEPIIDSHPEVRLAHNPNPDH